MNLLVKLSRSLTINGLYGTVRIAFQRVLPHKQTSVGYQDPGQEFDRVHGTDTCGQAIPLPENVIGKNWKHGQRYQGIDPGLFTEVIGSLGIPFSEYTFLDIGSGKGRALILAHAFGFKQLVGVEYARDICETARANCGRLGIPANIVHGDASTFPLPEKSLVVFMYNPFGAKVMAQLVELLCQDYSHSPRAMIIVYITPQFETLWRSRKCFLEIRRNPVLLLLATKEVQMSGVVSVKLCRE